MNVHMYVYTKYIRSYNMYVPSSVDNMAKCIHVEL